MSGRAEQLIMSRPPEFNDPDEERTFRKQRLAVAFRVFAQLGYNTGPGGHAAVRDPERPDWFWTNPFGRAFECLRTSDLILVDAEGRLVQGEGIVNRAAFAIHSRLHEARPEVVASAHLHGVHGMAWSCLGRPLDPINQDSCAFFGDHEIYTQFDGPALELADGDRMAKVMGSRKALILQNHGLLTAGATVDAAAFWMIRMQTSCEVQLAAEAAVGPVIKIADDMAHATFLVNGTDQAGWFGFQPFYERVSRLEPDVLD